MDIEALQRAGATLRRRRKELGWTTMDAKKQLGLDTGEISRLENGRVIAPSLEKVIRYAAWLGFSPGEIAAEYGLWTPPVGGRFMALQHQLEKLGMEDRERVVDVMEALMRDALRESRRRA